jgi:hypothetical protein
MNKDMYAKMLNKIVTGDKFVVIVKVAEKKHTINIIGDDNERRNIK